LFQIVADTLRPPPVVDDTAGNASITCPHRVGFNCRQGFARIRYCTDSHIIAILQARLRLRIEVAAQ
jgi:hypothetical protein